MLEMLLKQFAPDLDLSELQGNLKKAAQMVSEMHAMQKESLAILQRLESRFTPDQDSLSQGKEHCNHDTTSAGNPTGGVTRPEAGGGNPYITGHGGGSNLLGIGIDL